MAKVNHFVPLSISMSNMVFKAAPTEGTVYFSAPLYSEGFLSLFVT